MIRSFMVRFFDGGNHNLGTYNSVNAVDVKMASYFCRTILDVVCDLPDTDWDKETASYEIIPVIITVDKDVSGYYVQRNNDDRYIYQQDLREALNFADRMYRMTPYAKLKIFGEDKDIAGLVTMILEQEE